MLTKEECLKALDFIEEETTVIEDYKTLPFITCNHLQLQPINEHFELQLTANECDLIILGLMKLENELGWDVTLLINKVLKHKYISPTAKGVVDCVEIE